MKDIYSILDDVRNEVQLDVYALYTKDETKHSIPEEIFSAIVGGIVVVYLQGLLDAEGQGKIWRAWFKEWYADLKKKRNVNPFAIESDAKAALDKVSQSHLDEAAHQQAKNILIKELVAAGLQPEVAESLAGKVALQMRQSLKN